MYPSMCGYRRAGERRDSRRLDPSKQAEGDSRGWKWGRDRPEGRLASSNAPSTLLPPFAHSQQHLGRARSFCPSSCPLTLPLPRPALTAPFSFHPQAHSPSPFMRQPSPRSPQPGSSLQNPSLYLPSPGVRENEPKVHSQTGLWAQWGRSGREEGRRAGPQPSKFLVPMSPG